MLRLFTIRLAQAVPVLLSVSILSFLLLRAAPGDPAVVQAGLGATPEALAAIREQYRLNDPLPTQYIAWLGQVLQGDLGRSFSSGAEVRDLIAQRVGVTAQLGIMALVIIVVTGIPLGVVAALRKDRTADQVVRVVSLGGISLPSFVIALLLVLAFGWYFPGILPYDDFVPLRDGIVDSLRHSILPAIALSAGGIGIVARLTRSSMVEVLGQQYITAGRALGLTTRELLWKDALKNALMPVLTVLGLLVGFILSGSVVVETVFGIAGLGRLLVESFSARDYNLTIAVMLFSAIVFVLVNLVVDLLYGVVNPRVRMGYRSGRR